MTLLSWKRGSKKKSIAMKKRSIGETVAGRLYGEGVREPAGVQTLRFTD